MKSKLGIIIFWLTWPGLWLMLYWSKRTRILITCGDEIVVVKAWLSNGKWSLPGGGIHHREDPLIAVVREAKEEIGLSLSESSVVSIGSYRYHQNGLSFSCAEYTIALSRKDALKAQLGEIAEAVWIHSSELNSANANFDTLHALNAGD